MNICLLTRHNPHDRNSWSGITYHILYELRRTHTVEWVGGNHLTLLEKLFLKVYLKVFGYYKFGFWYYSSLHSKINNAHIQRIVKKKYDLIVALNAPDYLAYLKTDTPVVYVNDATFQLFTNFYPSFFNMSQARLKEGNTIEQYAIQKARYLVYSSMWAAESAIRFYNADEKKIRVISFGANFKLEQAHDGDISKEFSEDVCRLLFVARDWQRKGGETLLEVVNELRKSDFPFKLTVVGCDPNLNGHEDVLHVIPFLDKNNEAEMIELEKIYSQSHLLVLPTIADCTPVVFSEAAAFGIPVITTETGGISSLIRDGVNGFMLPASAEPKQFANKIKSVFQDKELFNNLRSGSRKEYETRLSWKVWATKFNEIIEEGL